MVREDGEVSNPQPTQSSVSLQQDAYARHIAARLRDFFADTTTWQRRLWDTGAVLALRELSEASEWCEKGALSAGAVTWLARDIERLVGNDRGVGERDLRTQLRDTLRSSVPCGSRHHRRLRELTDFVNEDYVLRWAQAIDSAAPPSPERCSRALASHLLDCGYSMRFLRRWTAELLNSNGSLADLFDSAQQLAGRANREYDVVIPFTSLPRYRELATPLSNWMNAGEIHEWLSPLADYPRGQRLNGGLRYKIEARDAFAAADLAAGTVDRLKARSSHGRGIGKRGPVPVGDIWVSDGHEMHRVKLASEPRGAFVLSLEAERKVYDVGAPTPLDDALELAAALNYGPPGPAVSGGWAALEALLTSPADVEDAREGRGAVAADRAAVVVAASWPRGELTTLSHRHAPTTPDRLSIELAQVTVNKERARLVADALKAGRRLNLPNSSDGAAEHRMLGLVNQPKHMLRDVNRHMRTAMRRLYRQRNLLLHGGTTNSIALSAALRSAAPLVGAVLDRITQASLVEGIDPLQLAARASLNLELVGGDDGRHLVDLLD